MTPDLPGLPGRRRTYALVLGTAAALAVAGIAVPLALGHAPASTGPAAIQALQVNPADAPTPEPAAAVPGAAPPGVAAPTGPATGAAASPTATGAAAVLPVLPPGAPAPGGPAGSVPPGPPAPGVSSAPPAAGPGTTRRPGAPATTRPGGRGAPTKAPPASGNPATGQTGGPPPAGTRTASDTGVSPDTVTLGVALVDLGAAGQAGATISGYDPAEQMNYYRAYIDEVNARGGVNGRTIVPQYSTFNIVDSGSQQATCESLTADKKSFTVTNVLGVYGPPILCFTQKHQTPYLSNDGAVSSYYPASKGLLFTLQPSTLRTFANMVYELQSSGELGTASRIGVLREDDYLTDDSTAMERYLSGFGHTVTDGIMSSTDISQAPAQAAAAAQKMCAAGVTRVVLAVNSLYASQFIRGVDTQLNCHPAYYTSDFDFQMDGDLFVSGMPASYFTHALGVSSSRVGDPSSGIPTAPLEQACLDTYNARSGQAAIGPRDIKAARAVAVCGLVRAFVLGLGRAGLNPTRQGFAGSLAGLGSFDNPGYSMSTFKPGKTDAPEGVRIVQAFPTCGSDGKGCWKTTGDGSFRTAHFA